MINKLLKETLLLSNNKRFNSIKKLFSQLFTMSSLNDENKCSNGYVNLTVNLNKNDKLFILSKKSDENFKENDHNNDGDEKFSYQKSIELLNNLQSNYSVIVKARNERRYQLRNTNIEQMRSCLAAIGVDLDELNNLNIIHIAGTKGKGSTCALIESILREHGLKTGLFTSPHLIEVCERFRLNGKPIEKRLFANYFHHVYAALQQRQQQEDGENIFPPYFGFLTVLAFHIFLKENVDVAIIEVGIGGVYDNTNVIKRPVVTGITSLGYDHTNILGNDICDIAKNKAGIMKEHVPMFIGRQTYHQVLPVLRRHADSVSCPIYLCPPLDEYKTLTGNEIKLNLDGDVQKENASLALQITNYWLNNKMRNVNTINVRNGSSLTQRKDEQKDNDDKVIKDDKVKEEEEEKNLLKTVSAFTLSENDVTGLLRCRWPGRFQILKLNKNVIYFLDSAHTLESIKHCSKWFHKNSIIYEKRDEKDASAIKILLFSISKGRDSRAFIDCLLKEKFDLIFLTTIKLSECQTKSMDSMMNIPDEEINKDIALAYEYCLEKFIDEQRRDTSIIKKFNAVDITLSSINEFISNNQNKNVHIFVTGSLLLVGNVLSIIDPHLDKSYNYA